MDFTRQGYLSFICCSYTSTTYRDNKNKDLEEQLLNILAQFEIKGEPKWRIESEIRRKKEEEERRIKKELYQAKEGEFNRFMSMLAKSERWSKAEHLRGYVNTIEQNAIKSDNLTDEVQFWLRWAREKIDWYDPLVERDDDIFSDIDRDELRLPRQSFW